MRKFLIVFFAPLAVHAQIWQISPLDPNPIEVCQNDKVSYAISIWNNGTMPISNIEVSRLVVDHCPAILFQGSSCMMYLPLDTKQVGVFKNTTEFRGSPNYYEISNYPITVKSCR